MRRSILVLLMATPGLLAGCDVLGVETATAAAARRDAEGRAVGGACRHAARSIEQCYGMNKRVDKAAVFAGWREMNDYMRENKIDAVPPSADATASGGADAAETAESTDKADRTKATTQGG